MVIYAQKLNHFESFLSGHQFKDTTEEMNEKKQGIVIEVRLVHVSSDRSLFLFKKMTG